MLGPAGPYLLAVDDVGVAVEPRRGRQRAGVGAGDRLGNAKGLQAQGAAGDLRQILGLLRVRAVPQQRAHRVHLRMAGAAIAAGALHLFQHCRGGGEGQARAAMLLGDER